MARRARYRWRGFGEQARRPGPARRTHKVPSTSRGPTGPQQKLLAALSRELNIPYERPLTSADASLRIETLIARKRANRSARPTGK